MVPDQHLHHIGDGTVIVLGRVYVIAQRIRRGLELGLEAEVVALVHLSSLSSSPSSFLVRW